VRYVIYGAGAIGGTIGARLHQAGHRVALIARGSHLDVLRRDGLTFQTPATEEHLAIETVGSPSELEIAKDDVVLLTMKSQDTAAALGELSAAADPDVAVVCAQNGVESERVALRYHARVYGMFVWVAAQHLRPGVVQAYAAPPALGVLDLGRAPQGGDELADEVSSDLRGAGFVSRGDREIMRWKYGKLLSNLANAVEAILGPDAPGGELVRRARAEALACYEMAGIRYASSDEISERVAGNEELGSIDGQPRGGGSTWQSLARGSAGVETAYLNGEIVLLGRLHGVPTPANQALTQIAIRMAREGARPGSGDPLQIESMIETLNA
jgi:2-dehydropantoate 2-reductase